MMVTRMVLDSSTLICISEKGLSYVFEGLASRKNLKFVIPQEVIQESVNTPMDIKRFELNALRIKKLVSGSAFEVVSLDADSHHLTQEILEASNRVYWIGGNPLHLMHLGESATLALLRQVDAHAVGIDERTARMIIESPQRLREILSARNEVNVDIDQGELSRLKKLVGDVRFFRSIELIALAFQEGILEQELGTDPEALSATLYALKYGGCAVSEKEINEFVGSMK
ncbi:MAG: hypothetical protein HY917_00070 [Candidatus Diapherotrites archaeon]|nr:hypothetical protein [Candidatus Diapherotrites archaeon]